MKALSKFGFFIFLVLGLYLVNSGFEFFAMPNSILTFEKWIFLIAGIFLIFAGFKFLLHKKSSLSY